MKSVKHISGCYGCGVCAVACPKNVITMNYDVNGFLKPFVSQGCIDCGVCLKVCAFVHKDLSQKVGLPKCYAAWSRNETVRYNSSSGGVAMECGRAFISSGGKVCGVRYDVQMARAEHYLSLNSEQLHQSSGSKYMQSYTVDGFKALNKEERYLVFGSPCQIDSLRRYVKWARIEQNFVLADFFCHGVPSRNLWLKYLKTIERQIGKTVSAKWRDKADGWHDSYQIVVSGKRELRSKLSDGDVFYQLFLSDLCLGKACYADCKYKGRASSADIRIGDLWGSEYADDEKGVSAVLAYTDKGRELLEYAEIEMVEHPFEIIAEGQMQKPPVRVIAVDVILYLLRHKRCPLSFAALCVKVYRSFHYWRHHPRELITRLATKIGVR